MLEFCTQLEFEELLSASHTKLTTLTNEQTDEHGYMTFRPMQFQPMHFQPLLFQPLAISTFCIFNRPQF